MIPPTERVYVVVDSGLSRGAQAAQSIHAVAELASYDPEWFQSWTGGGNTIIVLESDDITNILDRFPWFRGFAIFREPDFDYKITAFAIFSDATSMATDLLVWQILEDLPLMGSTVRSKRQERKLQDKENKQRQINR